MGFLHEAGIERGSSCILLGVEDVDLVLEVAKLVGDEGVVYAVDNREEILDEVKRIAEENKVKNVKTLYSRLLERIPTLPNSWFNIALLHNTFERVNPYQLTLINETHRLLKQGGKAVVITRVKSLFSRAGIPEKRVRDVISKSQFKVLKEHKHGRETVFILLREAPEEA